MLQYVAVSAVSLQSPLYATATNESNELNLMNWNNLGCECHKTEQKLVFMAIFLVRMGWVWTVQTTTKGRQFFLLVVFFLWMTRRTSMHGNMHTDVLIYSPANGFILSQWSACGSTLQRVICLILNCLSEFHYNSSHLQTTAKARSRSKLAFGPNSPFSSDWFDIILFSDKPHIRIILTDALKLLT